MGLVEEMEALEISGGRQKTLQVILIQVLIPAIPQILFPFLRPKKKKTDFARIVVKRKATKFFWGMILGIWDIFVKNFDTLSVFGRKMDRVSAIIRSHIPSHSDESIRRTLDVDLNAINKSDAYTKAMDVNVLDWIQGSDEDYPDLNIKKKDIEVINV